jgi:hypothetical protein
VKGAAAWALDALALLLGAHNGSGAGEGPRPSVITEKCGEVEALRPLGEPAPRASGGRPRADREAAAEEPEGEVPFVASGGFQSAQKIVPEPGSKLREFVDAINRCSPDEAIRYCSPRYPQELLEKIEGLET